MDVNQVTSSHDDFDALLDASSLGAPRVQAVRRHTPAAVRDRLASRLTRWNLPAPAEGQSAPLSEQVTQSTQPPSQRSRKEQELQRVPQNGSGSHHSMQIKDDSSTGRSIVFVSHSASPDRIARHLNYLVEDAADPVAENIGRIFLDSYLGFLEVLNAVEASMETRLLAQLSLAELDSRYSRIGRYGMGVKLVLASTLNPEQTWHSGTLTGGPLGHRRFPHTDDNRCARAGWPPSDGHNLLENAWRLWGTGAAQHLAAAVRSAAWPDGFRNWPVLWADASGRCTRRMSAQREQGIARATAYVLGTVTGPWAEPRDARWPAISPDAGTHACRLAAVGLSQWASQGDKRSPARKRTDSGDGRRPWLDRFLAMDWPGAPARSSAVPETIGEHLVFQLRGWSATGHSACRAPQAHWRDVLAVLEVRQTAKGTGAAVSQVHGFSERLPAHRYGGAGRMPVSTYPWPDDCMPAPGPGPVVVTGTAEILRTLLSETPRRQVPVLLPLALKLLRPADGSMVLMSRACRIEAAQEAMTVRATTRMVFLAGCTGALPVTLTSHSSDPCAVYTDFEESSGEQIVETFAHDLLGTWMTGGSPGHGNTEMADRQPGDQADTRMDTRVRTTEGVMQRKEADLARFPDSTQENIDHGDEHHRMPSTRDAGCEELLSHAHLH
ncbi:hypothetical protein ACFWCA_36070 [Streptomyces phaeochromogenes]|uniref:hypothetical protein n=1 Tax=Streptomyces phaeochromogenes TaxID=1923 RepID=UPI0036CF1DC2